MTPVEAPPRVVQCLCPKGNDPNHFAVLAKRLHAKRLQFVFPQISDLGRILLVISGRAVLQAERPV